MAKRIAWSEDELKLALLVCLQIRSEGSEINKDNPRVIALSDFLRVLNRVDEESFRTPDGVRGRISYFNKIIEGGIFPDRKSMHTIWEKYKKSESTLLFDCGKIFLRCNKLVE